MIQQQQHHWTSEWSIEVNGAATSSSIPLNKASRFRRCNTLHRKINNTVLVLHAIGIFLSILDDIA